MHRLRESDPGSGIICRNTAHLILGLLFLFIAVPEDIRSAPSQNACTHGSVVEVPDSVSDVRTVLEQLVLSVCSVRVEEWHAALLQGGNTPKVPAKPTNANKFKPEFERALELLSCCFFSLIEPWNEDYRWLGGYAMRALVLVEVEYVGVGPMAGAEDDDKAEKKNVAETRANSYTESAAGDEVGYTFDSDTLNRIDISDQEWYGPGGPPPIYRFMYQGSQNAADIALAAVLIHEAFHSMSSRKSGADSNNTDPNKKEKDELAYALEEKEGRRFEKPCG